MTKKLRVNMVSESDVSVQGHGVHTAYEEMASALERRDDVELIRSDFDHLLDVDVLHFHTIGPGVWRKFRQRGPKKVVSAHIVPASFIGSLILAKYWSPVAKKYMTWFYNKADKVLAVSGTVAKVLHDDLKVPMSKIEVLYNTIDMARYVGSEKKRIATRKKLKIGKDEFVVVGNGQVQPRKRLDTFIAMAKALPDVSFVWIGGIPFKRLGASYNEMQRLLKTVPPNLRMTGIVKHDDVYDYLWASDVFCLPAEQENHPMAVLEAAGAGLPIVLRDIPEYNDTFKNDMIRCATDEQFIEAIKNLHDDPKFYAAWKKNTQKIATRFDSNMMAGRLVKMYRDLL